MSVLRIKIKGWEDGQQVERWLDKPDRWQLHSADTVTLVIDDMEVTINQKVGRQWAASGGSSRRLCRRPLTHAHTHTQTAVVSALLAHNSRSSSRTS
jgi:hypothetical protein